MRDTKVQGCEHLGSVLSCDAAGPRGAGGPGNGTVLSDRLVPPLCHVEMGGGRAIWLRLHSYDGVNLKLVASAAATLARSSRRTAGECKRDLVGR